MIIKGHNAIFEYICNYSHFADFTGNSNWLMIAFAGNHNFSSWQIRPISLVDFRYVVMSPDIKLDIKHFNILTNLAIESSYIDASHPMVSIRVLPILYTNFLYEIQGISIEIEGNRYMGRLPT